jgi:hypothetical protein
VTFATSVPDPDVFGPPGPHPDPLVTSIELIEIMISIRKFHAKLLIFIIKHIFTVFKLHGSGTLFATN